MAAFSLTAKQHEANELLASPATHIMLFGGSRSGKTFLEVRAIVVRAIKAPGSRHAILRFRFNAVKHSIAFDTFPKVMALCWPEVKYELNKSDWFAQLPNGSQIWFGGLDDKERSEKILGQEYATILLNECSQIPWQSRGIAVTRLAQRVMQRVDGLGAVDLVPKMYYDENPPNKGHWSYRLFLQKVDPEARTPIPNPADCAALQMNPRDNLDNLPAGYLGTLEALPARMQRRFLRGEFADANPSALFNEEFIDRWRVLDGSLPDMQRIVIAVDPSGSGDVDNADNDAIGIMVCGLGVDGNGYALEDLTVKAGPATWGRVVTNAYDRHAADVIVAETNFGGAMVKAVIETARPRTPYKEVHASRGKVVRAEPIASLVEKGKIRLVGYFHELEDELAGFTTNGYTGEGSPNRGDAFVWGMSELFPGLIRPPKLKPLVYDNRGYI
jgi:phage terminase large subunit-like protein